MKVTLIRQDNGSGKETLSICETGTLFDKMKTETKAGHITALREIIPLLEGTYARYEHIDKLPYIYSAVEYTRTKEGERKMKQYNGLVQLEVSRLAGGSEAEFVKRQAALLPQTFAAFCGSSGRSVKIWVRFALPDDGGLPVKEAEAELFHVHAYWLAVKCYQPMLPFDIDLKEPVLAQRCRMTLDESPYYNPDAVAIRIELTFADAFRRVNCVSCRMPPVDPVDRLLPGLERNSQVATLFSVALVEVVRKFAAIGGNDLQALFTEMAQNCCRLGIPEEEAVGWMLRYDLLKPQKVLIRSVFRSVYLLKKVGEGKLPLPECFSLVMQLEEFMSRRYYFRLNEMNGEVEYLDRSVIQFVYHPYTQKVRNTICLEAQKEGMNVWDKDIDRYVHSDQIPSYHPIESFLANLPAWDGKPHIRALRDRVP